MEEEVLVVEETVYEDVPVVQDQQPIVVDDTPTVVDTPEIDTSKTPAQQYIEDKQVESSLYHEDHLNKWLETKYNYNRAEAGSKWVAGKINDVQTQMGFLESLINENMYGELELQKYFFDQSLAVAQAYAKEKQSETAYGYYRAATESAIAEGQLTGWYMPPEGTYLLNQWTIARDKVNDPNISSAEKANAQRISRVAEGWFAKNNITTRGIETLANLSFKESVRHTKVMEKLQEQANQIAASQAAASAASARLSLREFNFQESQMELDFGFDINNDGIIGHTVEKFKELGSYESQQKWIIDNPDKAWVTLGKDYIEQTLGYGYQDWYDKYESVSGDKIKEDSFKEHGFLPNDSLSATKHKIEKGMFTDMDPSDNKIYTFKDSDGTALFYKTKHGTYEQILQDNLNLIGGKKASEVFNNINPKALRDPEGNILKIGDKLPVQLLEGSVSQNRKMYTATPKKQLDSVIEQEHNGYKVVHNAGKLGIKDWGTRNVVMEIEEPQEDGSYKTSYIEITGSGKVKDISKKNLNFKEELSYEELARDSMKTRIGTTKRGELIYSSYNYKGEPTYYLFDGRQAAIKTLLTESEVSKTVKNLQSIVNKTHNYINSSTEDGVEDIIGATNVEDYLQERHNSRSQQEMKEAIEKYKPKSKGVSGGGSAPKVDTSKKQSSKDSKVEKKSKESKQQSTSITDQLGQFESVGDRAMTEIEKFKKKQKEQFAVLER